MQKINQTIICILDSNIYQLSLIDSNIQQLEAVINSCQ